MPQYEVEPGQIWRNKKNGEDYVPLMITIRSDNDPTLNGKPTVIYRHPKDMQSFDRNLVEFLEKFERVFPQSEADGQSHEVMAERAGYEADSPRETVS